MKRDLESALERFRDHDAFEHQSGRTFTQVTTPFETAITVVESDGSLRVHLSIDVESLDSVVGESVPDVVEAGWFETFEQRVADARTVISDPRESAPEVTRGSETVTIELDVETGVGEAPTDAKAVVDFVEATWVQGLIPGYEYDDPAATLRQRARGRTSSE